MNPGDVLDGRLRIDRVIGVGGFGIVAAATHLELRHEVAIKMMKPEFAGDQEIVDRFLREARAVAGLRTEHVCRVFDVGRTADGTPYIVMELLAGEDVGQLLRRQVLPLATIVDFAVQACVALAEAHPRGIVHRDLKPPNLFVVARPGASSLVKVLDFGIAKAADELRLTHSATMLGSPQYMSPEQMTTPTDVDARTDIWSLGVTLYHAIARRLPFPSAQIGELAVMITSHPPQPIDVPPGLRAVLWRCLEKDRAARFPDVGALAEALAPFGGPLTQNYAALARTPPPSIPPVPSAPAERDAATLGTGASARAPARAGDPTLATLATPAPSIAPVIPGNITLATGASVGPPAPAPSIAPVGPPIGTGASVGPPAPAPAPLAPSPPRVPSRSRLPGLGLVVLVVAAGGLLAGYFLRGGSSDDAAPAPAASVSHDAAVALAPDAVVRAPLDANDDPVRREMEQALVRIEAMIRVAPDVRTLQLQYQNGAQIACSLGLVDKARGYFAKLTEREYRVSVLTACDAYHVDVR